ncbi:MAG: GtrA family protein [bacterium]|nr:GtrA family protein [bacterium]
MKRIETETLIIGAGPAGLACAMELLKAGKDFILVEADSQVGGLAKTYVFKEGDFTFRTDNGPHRFFSKNQYLYDFIESLIAEQWITVHRQTRQFIDGKFYDYPVNMVQALKNVGPWRAFHMGWDYLVAKIIYSLFKKPIKHFADYVYANFGKTLGEFNMINYTEKIWGIPATTIHQDWAGQRIKGLNIRALVADSFRRMLHLGSRNKPKTLVDTFYYPDMGAGLVYETIFRRVQEAGRTVFLNARTQSFKHDGQRFYSTVIATAEGEVEIGFENLVESIPLTEFIKMLEPGLPKEILEAGENLRHRSQVYLFLTLDKESVTNDQWIYFPNKEIPFARISEMKNFSAKMAPLDKTSLFIEFFVSEGDAVWNMSKEELLALAMPHLERMGFVRLSEIRNAYVIKKKNVYPIYDVDYKNYLSVVKKALDQFKNLLYIGRPGRFRYNNQDHSLEMGMLAAKSIIEGKKYDIEAVGSEDEYYEKGVLKEEIRDEGDARLFLGYVVTAGVATVVDVAILYFLTNFIGLYYLYSSIVSYVAGMITNYSTSKLFVFKNKSENITGQFSLFVVVAVIGLILNQIIIWLLVEYGQVWYLYAKFISILVVMFWSFYGHKKITFGLIK